MKACIGVIFGGVTVEHEVSVISALQVIHAIDRERYSVLPIYIGKDGTWYTGDSLTEIAEFKNIDVLLPKCFPIFLGRRGYISRFPLRYFRRNSFGKIDVAFPVVHGSRGEDGILQGYLEMMGVPYVGSDVLASAIGMDKVAMKAAFSHVNLPILKYVWLYAREWLQQESSVIDRIEKAFPYPVIVKPTNLGSSIGVTSATTQSELSAAVEIALAYSNRVIIEPMVQNLREINCSVLGDYESLEASVCEEPIRASGLLTFDDKYAAGSSAKGMQGAKRRIPADISATLASTIQDLAKRAFTAVQASGVARIDFLLDEATNQVYVNEINTIPGSIAFYLWEHSGLSFTNLIEKLIRLALKRDRETNQLTSTHPTNILSMGGKGGSKVRERSGRG